MYEFEWCSKVKVWIVNHYAWPPSGPGSSRHHSFAKYLCDRGHEVSLFVSNYNHFTHCERYIGKGRLYDKSIENGVEYTWLRVPQYKGNTFGRVINMLSFAKNLKKYWRLNQDEKPDVILGSTLTPFAALSAQEIALKIKVPFVLEVRDIWPMTLIDIGSMSPYHPFILWLGAIEKQLYRNSDHIITLLPKAHEHIEALGPPPPITWLPNGVDFSLLEEDLSVEKNEEEFNVVYAGSMGIANALEPFIEAAINLKDVNFEKPITFQLLGDGPERERLERKCKRSGADNIEFIGTVPKKQVYSYLQQADCFFISIIDSPLYKFGYSMNKIYDYMACSKPVIIATNADYNPIMEANAGITVQPESCAAIEKAIIDLLSMEPCKRIDLGINGKKHARKYHDLKGLTVLLETILKTTIISASVKGLN